MTDRTEDLLKTIIMVCVMTCMIAIGLAMVFFGSAAAAHSWYPHECCGDGDCHPVPCSEITESWAEGSLRWQHFTFMPDTIKDSQDSQCHVCTNEGGMSEWRGYCIFMPKPTS